MTKSIFSILTGIFILFAFPTLINAQSDTTVPDSPLPGENIAVPVDDTTTTTSTDDPMALQEGEIILFTHEDCPHCAKVEAFINSNGINDSVQSLQLKGSDENMELMQEYWEYFDVTPAEEGWPFMIFMSDGQMEYSVGDAPIIQDLSNLLNIENPVTETPEVTGSNNLLIIVGGLFFAAIAGYGLYSLFSSKNAGSK